MEESESYITIKCREISRSIKSVVCVTLRKNRDRIGIFMRLSHKFMLYGAMSAEMVSGHERAEGQERVVDNAERYTRRTCVHSRSFHNGKLIYRGYDNARRYSMSYFKRKKNKTE